MIPTLQRVSVYQKPRCQYVFRRGPNKGQYCNRDTLYGEDFCSICIFRREATPSPRLCEIMRRFNVEFFQNDLFYIEDDDKKYVVKYNGDLKLVGISDPTDMVYDAPMRNPTQQELGYALQIGIKI